VPISEEIIVSTGAKKKPKQNAKMANRPFFCVVSPGTDLVPTFRWAENPHRYWARAQHGGELIGGVWKLRHLIECLAVEKSVEKVLSNC
jgi:hypothetical protein